MVVVAVAVEVVVVVVVVVIVVALGAVLDTVSSKSEHMRCCIFHVFI